MSPRDYPNDVSANASPIRGWLMLAAWMAIAAATWLILLPAIGRRPAMIARSKLYEAKGIDPGAMFYTELPATERMLADLRRFHREHPAAFWKTDRGSKNPKVEGEKDL